jgi:hypothetical protein
MTFKLLKEIIEKNNIPEDVKLYSDNDWDDRYCCLDGVYYDESHNELTFTDGTEDQAYDYRDCLCLYRNGLETEKEEVENADSAL